MCALCVFMNSKKNNKVSHKMTSIQMKELSCWYAEIRGMKRMRWCIFQFCQANPYHLLSPPMRIAQHKKMYENKIDINIVWTNGLFSFNTTKNALCENNKNKKCRTGKGKKQLVSVRFIQFCFISFLSTILYVMAA